MYLAKSRNNGEFEKALNAAKRPARELNIYAELGTVSFKTW
jgi:hypothetical protein